MVALGEKLCRNDTKAQRGRRRRRVGFGRNGNSPAASGYSVISVAGNYPNGGLTGNIPNGTTDCIWQHWQTMEERNPFGSSGSTQRPKGISMLSDSTIRTQRVYWGFAFLVVGWAPSSARLGGSVLLQSEISVPSFIALFDADYLVRGAASGIAVRAMGKPDYRVVADGVRTRVI